MSPRPTRGEGGGETRAQGGPPTRAAGTGARRRPGGGRRGGEAEARAQHAGQGPPTQASRRPTRGGGTRPPQPNPTEGLLKLFPSTFEDGDLVSARAKNNEYDEVVAFGDQVSYDMGRKCAAQILMKLKENTPGSKRLFPLTLRQLEQSMSSAANAAGLPASFRCNPHALRHGGPSEDYAANKRSLLDIQKRGHWKAF